MEGEGTGISKGRRGGEMEEGSEPHEVVETTLCFPVEEVEANERLGVREVHQLG